MRSLQPLDSIPVPSPRKDETYQLSVAGHASSFKGLKALLGAADYSKAGDRNSGLSAENDLSREAARTLLSRLSLEEIYDRPLTDAHGQIDSVMRVNYDIDLVAFSRIAHWTVGELKDWILRSPPHEVNWVGKALTGVMAAALAKILDVHELVFAARKFSHPSLARTHLGLPGTLSSRLQPNHPSDDPRGVSLLVYAGLSMASGDALIGMNPAIDTVDNIESLLHLLDKLRRKVGAPTQTCVLSHIKTQLACLERGAPVEILFQSLAGTENTNLTEFDLTVDLLDQGYRTMAEKGALKDTAKQFMYFETGQGSEFTYGKHNGTDMATLEALCYGLARRYDPFMVNNVTGFIGPETHLDNMEMVLSNLQDHFMGKVLGLPMGMAPCYTLHSKITLDGQQIATELLTAAGANYYMDVYLNTDRMLAYFDTSSHDNQTLREIHQRAPAPEFAAWAVERGILKKTGHTYERGEKWGRPEFLCDSEQELASLMEATPTVYAFAHSGPRPSDEVSRELRHHQAIAREAIRSELDLDFLRTVAPFRTIETAATSKESHLNAPHLGAALAANSKVTPEPFRVQIVVSDGLSAEAVHANLTDLYPVLRDGLAANGLELGAPWAARYGRVKLAEPMAEALDAELIVLLIGERPGGDAQASRSLSCYFVYRLTDKTAQDLAAQFSGNPKIRFEYTVLSNIYERGLPPAEAGSVLTERCLAILNHRAAGNRLESILKGH